VRVEVLRGAVLHQTTVASRSSMNCRNAKQIVAAYRFFDTTFWSDRGEKSAPTATVGVTQLRWLTVVEGRDRQARAAFTCHEASTCREFIHFRAVHTIRYLGPSLSGCTECKP
jgi:hypothetical protein